MKSSIINIHAAMTIPITNYVMNISRCVCFLINIITKSLSHSLHVPLPSLSLNEIEMSHLKHKQLMLCVKYDTNIRLLVVENVNPNEVYRK